MSAQYVFRLDDASEYMDYEKWNRYFELFDLYNIKPVIAVIPFNRDPKLINRKPDIHFWEKVRHWQSKGYRIALHGYEHIYATKNSGILGINRRSEFAGIDYLKQKKMITESYKKFEDESINVDIFVAPAHSFDRNTLKALESVTHIRYISDGFFLNPVKIGKFKWIPQQLWEPKNKSKGTWTICLHPETEEKQTFSELSKFIKEKSGKVKDPLTLTFSSLKLYDILFCCYKRTYYSLRLVTNRLHKISSLFRLNATI